MRSSNALLCILESLQVSSCQVGLAACQPALPCLPTDFRPQTIDPPRAVDLIKECQGYAVKFHGSLGGLMGSASWTISVLLSSEHSVRCCAVYLGRKVLAASTPQKSVQFYSLRSGGRVKCDLAGLPALISCLAFHPDGGVLVVGCVDGSKAGFNTEDHNRRICRYGASRVPVRFLSVSTEQVLSLSEDHAVQCFSLWTGVPLRSLQLDPGPLITAFCCPQTTDFLKQPVLAGTERGGLMVLDLEAPGVVLAVAAHAQRLRAILLEGDLVITGSDDATVRVWSLTGLLRGGPDLLCPYHSISVQSPVTALSLLEHKVYAGCMDGRVRGCSTLTGMVFKTLNTGSGGAPVLGVFALRDGAEVRVSAWHEAGVESQAISTAKFRYKEPYPKYFHMKSFEQKERERILKERRSRIGQEESSEVVEEEKRARRQKGVPRLRGRACRLWLLQRRGCTAPALRATAQPATEFRTDPVTLLAARAGPVTQGPDGRLKVLQTFPRLEQL